MEKIIIIQTLEIMVDQIELLKGLVEVGAVFLMNHFGR